MKWTARKLRELKGGDPFAALTAYDAFTGRIADEAGLPLCLVGDSLAGTVLGYDDTLPVTMDEMLHHAAAVGRVVTSALIVADMPFMSYQPSVADGLRSAGRFLKQARSDAVKIEGGAHRAELISACRENGIPVLGHIGLTPQSVREIGGYRIQGREPEEVRRLLDDAMAVEQAGAFAVVLECMPASLGAKITEALTIPTIGIGAGPDCDGQVLVISDLLGMNRGRAPRFVKRYADFASEAQRAVEAFRDEVGSRRFPSSEHCYGGDAR
ncbi:3-methyl-2-oxobutanoate hydroxymethyltransferase [Kiritimatiella glycovorans]|uniref:3-methyl-2-oxobutanoate hydroxymethyltransferase n=1 Tax=Kiritimatiella glycovorans TaxID=1307763 RepID=A0A0G3EJU8_9BACT|nr:3-methyl-2-oxobutanoate hydroxymethyltransferase [Kiritimatiella glycovorans]AKJ64404.1 3-methyl-2-oxobutanoate hydroxymethyltransferase [Kiritimatiella glycovorans]